MSDADEDNGWMAIGAALVVVLILGGVGTMFFVQRSRLAAMRAEEMAVREMELVERQRAAAAKTITRDQAIKIAEEHLGIGPHEVDARLEENGEWWVLITRLPAVPGGHTTVVIDGQGRVVRVVGGR